MSADATVQLVLASASEARAQLLTNAGIAFVRDPADVDEAAIKAACRTQPCPPEEAAIRLAAAKASVVAVRHAGSLVIGADQLLVCGEEWLDKPQDVEAARATLRTLRGRHHRLISAVIVARDAAILWRHVEVAHLAMRAYSDRFIDWYLAQADARDLQVVGACRLEGLGAQALAQLNGDYFTVLGLPLLPLLAFLRQEGALVD